MVSADTLTAAKRYMRIDASDDDDTISALLEAAEGYLTGAGISPQGEPDERYNLALFSLALHWYDHRDAAAGEAELPAGLRPLLNQLKFSGAGVL